MGLPEQPAWTPLKAAVAELAEGGPIDAILLLLRHRAAVDGLVPNDATPLLVAVLNRQLDAARLLLAAGADPNRTDDEGDSPLRVSVEQDDGPMTTLLLLSGAASSINESGGLGGMNALGRAAWMLNIPMIKLLLSAGADPDHLDSDRRPAYKRLPPREGADIQAWEEAWAMLKR